MSTTTRRAVRPRDVFCVVAEEHRDLALAEAVATGHFTHVGTTVELGPLPEWRSPDLPADEEWRIEWWKFGYGLDLAHAFEQTGDPRFAETWERLVTSFVEQVPVGADTSDVAARRIQNWLYAWSSFARSRELAPELTAQLCKSLAAQNAFVRHNLTAERNHRTLELYALYVAALALPSQLDANGAQLAFSVAELHRNLLTDFRGDGVHREASTHYHLVALRSFVAVRENARRFGVALPVGYDALLSRACDFALHCHRPDGAIPALSDSDTGRYGNLLELAGSLLGRDDLRGRAPAERSASFPMGGYFFQRSGWSDANERFLVFDCGPLGDGGHGHYDLLSIEAASDGRPLVVDPGRYTYSEESPNWRRWFKGTAAHNTVCVDGLDQTPYRRGKPRGPVPEGRLLERLAAQGLDVLAGQAVSPIYDAVHTRRIVFVADEFWLVEDQLEAPTSHTYDLRFHLPADAEDVTEVTDGGVRAPGLALVLAEPARPMLEHGWVAPRYGQKLPAPVVSAVLQGGDAQFLTLIAPLGPDRPMPRVRVDRVADATLVVVDEAARSRGVRDHVAWSAGSQLFELGPVRIAARAAWVREQGGMCVAVRAFDATEALWTESGEPLMTAARPLLAWDRGGH
jgi:GNAT superfamily N-acetyltransferase